MEISNDSYKEIFSYVSDRQILRCSLVSKNWFRLLKDRRDKIITYGISPEIIRYSAIKYGKYHGDTSGRGRGVGWFHPCENTTFYLYGNRFEISVSGEKDPYKIKEEFDNILKYLWFHGFNLDMIKDEIYYEIKIYYNLDLCHLSEEILKLDFVKSNHTQTEKYWAFECFKIEDHERIRLFFRQIREIDESELILKIECPPKLWEIYHMKIMAIIERIRLPRVYPKHRSKDFPRLLT